MEKKETTQPLTSEQISSRKADMMKSLQEAGVKIVQKTGSILMPLSKKQRESLQLNQNINKNKSS